MTDVELFSVACQTVNALGDLLEAARLRLVPAQVIETLVGSQPYAACGVGADGVDLVDVARVPFAVDVVARESLGAGDRSGSHRWWFPPRAGRRGRWPYSGCMLSLIEVVSWSSWRKMRKSYPS